jgi:crotonobetainyl-CoA:carnitine CoA-transferase CaiB-like acyl-CoA transferase
MQPPRALEDVKVLDFTRVLSGPYATMMLGDLGAEIIKVEPPQGDESRTWPPLLKNGQSGYFMALNRNKKSITLNLKTPEAQQIVRDMAGRVDVVVENFTPGVVRKLGIDYETLKKVNPGLIYCSISGFGQDGPYRDKKAYDPIIQGMTGIMSITGEKNRPPVKIGIPITDLVAAAQSVNAILTAYIHKLKSGQGQYIDVALYDSMISMLTIMAMDYFASGKAPERWGLDHIHRVPARAFETRDGKYVQVAATSDVMYAKFCRLLGLDELIEDPRFDTNTKRVANRDQIMPRFEEKMALKDSRRWLTLFEEAGIPCGPILDLKEVFTDPNISARGLSFSMDHPTEKTIQQLGFPFRLSLTPARAHSRPPLLSEHTDQILTDWLNYDSARIQHFKQNRVV